MSKPVFVIKHLLEDEWRYEAAIREINQDLSQEAIMRELRLRMRNERLDRSIAPAYYAGERDVETNICRTKLDEIAQLNSSSNKKLDVKSVKRLVARGIHLRTRIKRLHDTHPENEDIVELLRRVREFVEGSESSESESDVDNDNENQDTRNDGAIGGQTNVPATTRNEIDADEEQWRPTITNADKICGAVPRPANKNQQRTGQLSANNKTINGKGADQKDPNQVRTSGTKSQHRLRVDQPANVENSFARRIDDLDIDGSYFDDDLGNSKGQYYLGYNQTYTTAPNNLNRMTMTNNPVRPNSVQPNRMTPGHVRFSGSFNNGPRANFAIASQQGNVHNPIDPAVLSSSRYDDYRIGKVNGHGWAAHTNLNGLPNEHWHNDNNMNDNQNLLNNNQPMYGNAEVNNNPNNVNEPVRNANGNLNRTTEFHRNFSVRCDRKSVPVARWNLKFSGDGNGTMSLNEFLDKVKLHMKARHVSESELLESAFDLFTGSALNWYQANHERFYNWRELENELKAQFLPYDYQFYLWREIEERTQGTEEKFGIYLAVMENLFKRLGYPVPEEHKLAILLRNLQPYYTERLCFQRYTTLRDLKYLCMEIEENRNRVMRFKQPPTYKSNLMEPSMAYKHRNPSKINCVDHKQDNSDQSEIDSEQDNEVCAFNKPAAVATGNEGRQYKCFNCGKTGHLYKDCKEPKSSKIACFSCGTKEKGKVVCGCVPCLKKKVAQLEGQLKQVKINETTYFSESENPENWHAE